MKEIIVYWGISHLESKAAARFVEPVSLTSHFFKGKNIKDYGYKACPSFLDFTNNVFVLKSPYKYNFTIKDNGDVRSELYDQLFFDTHVLVRSIPSQLFSLRPFMLFCTEEESLTMSLEHPWFDNNSYTQRCITIPGQIDIGKYFRSLDFAFHLNKEFKEFNIEEGDPFYYLRFHTKRKIIFKRFMFTTKILDYSQYVWNIKESTVKKFRPMEYFYKIYNRYNYKKHIMKEIKENLVEW